MRRRPVVVVRLVGRRNLMELICKNLHIQSPGCARGEGRPDDRYGDIYVDTNLSHAVYQKWKALTRPAPGPGNLRRPLWFPRVARPAESTYYFSQSR